MMVKPIILVSGSAGVGKTTIARDLVNKINIDHRIGTGFVREIMKACLCEDLVHALSSYTFRASEELGDIIEKFVSQAKLLKYPIWRCIRRAKREGTSVVIEGNHLLPNLYNELEEIDLFVVLKQSNEDILKKRVSGATHKNRIISEIDFANILKIQDYLVKQAMNSKLPIIECHKREKTTQEIIKLLWKKTT